MPLLVGLDPASGADVAGSWLDLYSTAVGGLPGAGKTNTQRFLAAQTALQGAKFVVLDPHAGAADDSLAGTLAPLASAYLVEPAESVRDMLDIVRYVSSIAQKRVETGRKPPQVEPIILWIDELTGLLARSSIGPELSSLLENVAQSYRKVGVFVCASGQIWTASRTPSELRGSFASVIAHRMRRDQARLLLPTEDARAAEKLATGQAILWRTSGISESIQVPLTTSADVQRVATMVANGKPDASLPVATMEALCTAPEQSKSVSPEAARAAEMFRGGVDLVDIVGQLRGVKSNQGRRYQEALKDVQELIRAGL